MLKKIFNKSTFIIVFSGIVIPATAQQVSHKIKPGKGLYEIVYNEQSHSVYVASAGARGQAGGGKIYRLDPATLIVKDSIDVSSAPAYGLGLNQKTQTLYTSNTRSNSVHAIDLNSGKIIATISGPGEKHHTREIVVDEAENLIYVSDVGGGIWVIDGKTNTLKEVIKDAGSSVTGLAFDKNNNILFAIDNKSSKVMRYDLKKKIVTDSFPTGSKGAINLVLDEKTNRLFIANQGDGEMTVLDAKTGKLLHTVATGKGALGISFSQAKNLIYVANRGEGTVTVLDATTYKIIANLETGTYPNTVALDKNGNAYVTNKAGGADDENGDVVTRIEF